MSAQQSHSGISKEAERRRQDGHQREEQKKQKKLKTKDLKMLAIKLSSCSMYSLGVYLDLPIDNIKVICGGVYTPVDAAFLALELWQKRQKETVTVGTLREVFALTMPECGDQEDDEEIEEEYREKNTICAQIGLDRERIGQVLENRADTDGVTNEILMDVAFVIQEDFLLENVAVLFLDLEKEDVVKNTRIRHVDHEIAKVEKILTMWQNADCDRNTPHRLMAILERARENGCPTEKAQKYLETKLE